MVSIQKVFDFVELGMWAQMVHLIVDCGITARQLAFNFDEKSCSIKKESILRIKFDFLKC